MSLLMEALKKAEEAKRQAAETPLPANGAGATPELALEPIAATAQTATPARTPAFSPLPDLSLHIDSVDADLAAVSTEAPAKRRPHTEAQRATPQSSQENAERSAVRNAFAAKQAPKSRTGLLVLISAGIVALITLGAYFWWQLQSVSSGTLAPPPRAQALPAPAPVQAVAPSEAKAPALAPADLPAPAKQESIAASVAPIAAARTAEAPLFERRPPAQKAANTGGKSADGALRLNRSQPRSVLTLEQAYDALQAGKLQEAQQGYEQVLRTDAKNTDALLGLATIASRQGQTERAHAYYLQAQESDPNDATAQAGLINSKGQADPGRSESQLKTALSSQPDSSALLFALGNLYARQLRWSDAQQAYFKAYASEPDNPDIIFNLAVSLDQLRQSKLAAQYYQMALNAAGGRAVAFDRSQVRNRILELQP